MKARNLCKEKGHQGHRFDPRRIAFYSDGKTIWYYYRSRRSFNVPSDVVEKVWAYGAEDTREQFRRMFQLEKRRP